MLSIKMTERNACRPSSSCGRSMRRCLAKRKSLCRVPRDKNGNAGGLDGKGERGLAAWSGHA
ncbi:MAG: hypothetical protein LBO63_06880 [Oscillospiraceae bacterium]|nr:hypothetical protein [Oscillospiraceae bacterium]